MTGRTYANKSAAQRSAERRQRLLDAALELFGTEGYRRTPIEQLCQQAGVSTRSFYEEFGAREQLLIAVHDEINRRVFEAVAAAVTACEDDDVEGRVHAGARAYFETMMGDPRRARIGLVETVGVSPEVEAARRAAIDRFEALLSTELDRFQALGLVPKRDYSLTVVAAIGALYGLAQSWTTDPGWDAHVDDVIEEATRAILRLVQV